VPLLGSSRGIRNGRLFPESGVREQQAGRGLPGRSSGFDSARIVHGLIPQGNVKVAPGKDHPLWRGLHLPQALNQVVMWARQKFQVELALVEDGSDWYVEVNPGCADRLPGCSVATAEKSWSPLNERGRGSRILSKTAFAPEL
jgi:hypothetical protein